MILWPYVEMRSRFLSCSLSCTKEKGTNGISMFHISPCGEVEHNSCIVTPQGGIGLQPEIFKAEVTLYFQLYQCSL